MAKICRINQTKNWFVCRPRYSEHSHPPPALSILYISLFLSLSLFISISFTLSPCRRAARRGQGGRLTTLNFLTGAATTLDFFHVLIFLWSNISRKQTRQYRKSTTTTSRVYNTSEIWRRKPVTSRVYHGYQQVWSQLRSALPILPSTQRPDFKFIFKRLLSKSACLRGSAPDPAGGLQRPQTPSWKRLVLTFILLHFLSYNYIWVLIWISLRQRWWL